MKANIFGVDVKAIAFEVCRSTLPEARATTLALKMINGWSPNFVQTANEDDVRSEAIEWLKLHLAGQQ